MSVCTEYGRYITARGHCLYCIPAKLQPRQARQVPARRALDIAALITASCVWPIPILPTLLYLNRCFYIPILYLRACLAPGRRGLDIYDVIALDRDRVQSAESLPSVSVVPTPYYSLRNLLRIRYITGMWSRSYGAARLSGRLMRGRSLALHGRSLIHGAKKGGGDRRAIARGGGHRAPCHFRRRPIEQRASAELARLAAAALHVAQVPFVLSVVYVRSTCRRGRGQGQQSRY